jgi:hypothetical protein
MNAKRLGLVVVLVLAVALVPAQAAQAAPPLGLWQGRFADGSGTLALLVKGNGDVVYTVNGALVAAGKAGWKPTSRGGILTIEYVNAGRFVNHLYYSVTYLDSNTAVFSDPGFRVKLHRQ